MRIWLDPRPDSLGGRRPRPGERCRRAFRASWICLLWLWLLAMPALVDLADDSHSHCGTSCCPVGQCFCDVLAVRGASLYPDEVKAPSLSSRQPACPGMQASSSPDRGLRAANIGQRWPKRLNHALPVRQQLSPWQSNAARTPLLPRPPPRSSGC